MFKQRKYVFATAMVMFLLVLFAIPGVRAAASDFLGLFGVQKFAPISVSPQQLAMLEQIAEQGLVPGELTMDEAPNKQQKFLVDKTLYELQGGLKKYFVEDAKQVLLEAANLGYSQKQIEKRLRQRLLSQPDKDSYYIRYATQVSRDSVNQYNGQVNQMVQDEYDLDMIRYVGSVVDDSRPFCIPCKKGTKR